MGPGVPSDGRTLRPAPSLRLPHRAGGGGRRAGLASRFARGKSPPGSHGPASALDAGRASAPLARRSGSSAAARAPAEATARSRGRPRPCAGPKARRVGEAPHRGLGLVLARVLGMARARALRPRPPLGGLAPRRARVLLHHRAPLLAPGHPGLARTIGVATVGDDSLPRTRRGPEHGPRRDPHVLGPRDLSGLRGGAATRGSLGPRGSGDRGRTHVGPGLDRVRAAHDRSRRAHTRSGALCACGSRSPCTNRGR